MVEAYKASRVALPVPTSDRGIDGAFNAACARIAELEAERNAAHRAIADLSRRPTLETVLALETLCASLRAALADAQAKLAPPAPAPVEASPIHRAIRHSRQPIGLLPETP